MEGKFVMKRKYWRYYLMLLPALAISVAIILIPAITTIFTSFTDSDGISKQFHWVGLQNYYELLGNSVFVQSLGNNLMWMIIFMFIPVGIAVLTAACLITKRRGRNFYQVIFLIPYVIAPIANALIWLTMIYNPLTGIVGWLKAHGVAVSSPLSNPSSALYGVAAVDIWHYWGFLCVIFFAALRQTSTDQLEAATLDGCNGVQLFRYIYFPSMLPTFKIMLSMIMLHTRSCRAYGRP